MKCPNCNAEINDSAKFCLKCDVEIKHHYIWLTIPNCCSIKDIQFQSGVALEENLKNQIWFEDTKENRARAKSILKDIK